MAEHARLSASKSKVWLACTAMLTATEHVEDRPSAAAEEGTIAHELCEKAVRERFFGEVQQYPEGRYTEEMFTAAAGWRALVEELITEVGPDPVIFVEERVDYSTSIGVAGQFGTSDLIMIWPEQRTLVVADFKFGKGVRVDATENSQMKLYAAGALEIALAFCDIDRVIMIVDQPRREHRDRWETTAQSIADWCVQITPVAQEANTGPGTFTPGDHCDAGFCAIRKTCAARAAEAQRVFKENDRIPGVLTPEEIANLLPLVPRMVAFWEGLRDFALENATKHGQKYPGWKLVAGAGRRKWSDEELVAAQLQAEGIEPWKRTLLGIGEVEKKVGKNHKVFELTIKAEGAPILVPATDKRAELTTAIDANFED